VGEAFDREKSLERQIRAFHWIRLLAELPARFAGSPSEREAADRIESWLRELGVEDVQRQVVVSRPAAGLVLALHLGVAALACLVGGGFGALLGVLAAVSIRAELRRGASLLSRVLPNPESLNVVGRAGARHPGQRIVLSAHIDSAQAGWLFTPAVADFELCRALCVGHCGVLCPIGAVEVTLGCPATWVRVPANQPVHATASTALGQRFMRLSATPKLSTVKASCDLSNLAGPMRGISR
jgi:hypothetical protein